MVKLVIFDLDGVLVDAKELHYESLNLALGSVSKEFIISREEHLTKYDGLTTKTKLKMLTEEKSLPIEHHNLVWQKKQEFTNQLIKTSVTEDSLLRNVLEELKILGYKIFVASNSIRETVKLMLFKTGLIEFVDYYLGNEDVTNNKPHPEIYLKSMVLAGVKPSETLILEDSFHGKQAANDSGAHVLSVDSKKDVTILNIKSEINKINKRIETNNKWVSSDTIVLIPMAGAGSRFANAGFTFPKPLIDVRNKPMVQLVVENLNINAKFIYIVQKEHYEKYNLKFLLNLITPDCEIVQVDSVTEGAACTTLLAKKFINNDKHLLICNSDQYIEWESDKFYYSMINEKIDGGLLTFESTHPKWSFVKTDDNSFISEIAEKKPISNIATVGIYYWNKGSEYVKFAEQMIQKNKRINGEFYVAPVYNEAIEEGYKFKIHKIKKMWGLGTPEDLSFFLENNQ